MECPICKLRYNADTRKPKMQTCSDNLCQQCQRITTKCPQCNAKVNPIKSIVNKGLIKAFSSSHHQFDKIIKICFVGQMAVGKTTLINSLQGKDFKVATVPTIGIDFSYIFRRVNGLNIRYDLWDTAGQQSFRAISKSHYKNSHIVIIVYDITLSQKENDIDYWLHQIDQHSPQNVRALLVGNKIDISNQLNVTEVSYIDENKLQTMKIKSFRVSCKMKTGIQQLWAHIDALVQEIISMERVAPRQMPPQEPRKNNQHSSIILDQVQQQPSSSDNGCRC